MTVHSTEVEQEGRKKEVSNLYINSIDDVSFIHSGISSPKEQEAEHAEIVRVQERARIAEIKRLMSE